MLEFNIQFRGEKKQCYYYNDEFTDFRDPPRILETFSRRVPSIFPLLDIFPSIFSPIFGANSATLRGWRHPDALHGSRNAAAALGRTVPQSQRLVVRNATEKMGDTMGRYEKVLENMG